MIWPWLLTREGLETVIERVEKAQHQAAEARRVAEEAERRANDAAVAAERAECMSHELAKDLGVAWQAIKQVEEA